MYLSEDLYNNWKPVLENKNVPPIKDSYRKAVTTVLLENQKKWMQKNRDVLSEAAPTNSGYAASSGDVQGYDPVLISLVRRSLPNLIAYDICGVQPMTGPTGLIFAIRSRYSSQSGTEALFNEADTDFAGASSPTHSGGNPVTQASPSVTFTTGQGMTTATAEALGSDLSPANEVGFQEMAFSIEKVTVTARTRALKAEYSTELAQDLRAIHGLDAETELANILSTEILAEINREVVRTIYNAAQPGAQYNTTTAGLFDLNQDADGRWSVERWKGLLYQIDRDANYVGRQTRRGKGNVLVTSSDVASALSMVGALDYAPALESQQRVVSDDTGNTFAGVMWGRIKVFVDPYFDGHSNNEFYVVGYRGTNQYDAGIFYCPYVPLEMVRAIGEDTFQPKIGFKTRYGIVANPFGNSGGGLGADTNTYYARTGVLNML